MIRTIAKLFLLALLAPSAVAAPPIPAVPRGRIAEYETSARVIGKAGRFEPLADLTARWQFEGHRPYRSLMLGSYVRAHRNLKVGAFCRLQNGARHDDDWTKNASGHWFWRTTTNRPESVLVLDATPRASLGGSFTGSLKVRYEHNAFNGQGTLKLEPEVAWFWMKGLEPKATLFLRHGTYIPLNFGTRSFYERWWYMAGLWHPAASFSAGPSVALRDTVWTESSVYRGVTRGGTYRVLHRAIVWGFTALLRFR